LIWIGLNAILKLNSSFIEKGSFIEDRGKVAKNYWRKNIFLDFWIVVVFIITGYLSELDLGLSVLNFIFLFRLIFFLKIKELSEIK
jgi:hypothetical protein